MSKKTGKLNKVEKFYIENNSDKEISQIAKDLNRSEAKSDDASSLMGHNDRGSTVMTPAASELSDSTRGKRLSKNINHSAIHKIK